MLGSILRFPLCRTACRSRFSKIVPTSCSVPLKGYVSGGANQFEAQEDGRHNNPQLAPLKKISIECTEIISFLWEDFYSFID